MQIDSTLSMPAAGYLPFAAPKISAATAAQAQAPVLQSTGTTGTLQEPPVATGGGTAVLRDGGSASVQMAAALYTLNVSFDMQKVALDLLA